MSGITCPRCGLFSPESAERCDCGYDFNTRANPNQQTQDTRRVNPVAALVGLGVLVVMVWYYIGGGLENQAARDLQKIQDKVAADAVTQYEIAKRNGSQIDACVQAGMVAAAYLQAKDEAHYQQWKQTEKADCAKAGVPR